MASVSETQTLTQPEQTQVTTRKRKLDNKVAEIFESLDYGPAPESSQTALAWLQEHGNEFGHFIDGKWVKPQGRKFYETKNPATGKKN